MTLGHKIVVGYFSAVGAVFLVGYVFLDIRELGLYLFLMAINFPGSLIVVPQMEAASLAVGLVLGKLPHILATQIICMVTNGLVLLALVTIGHQLQSGRSKKV
jgi:hypothetical protein